MICAHISCVKNTIAKNRDYLRSDKKKLQLLKPRYLDAGRENAHFTSRLTYKSVRDGKGNGR